MIVTSSRWNSAHRKRGGAGNVRRGHRLHSRQHCGSYAVVDYGCPIIPYRIMELVFLGNAEYDAICRICANRGVIAKPDDDDPRRSSGTLRGGVTTSRLASRRRTRSSSGSRWTPRTVIQHQQRSLSGVTSGSVLCRLVVCRVRCALAVWCFGVSLVGAKVFCAWKSYP